MLQPLRESRDHYEELKQMDDAMKEVTVAASTHSLALEALGGGHACGLSSDPWPGLATPASECACPGQTPPSPHLMMLAAARPPSLCPGSPLPGTVSLCLLCSLSLTWAL